MDVTIRRGTAVDAPALARLRWRWRTEERGEVGLDREGFVEYCTAWIVDHLATHRPFVAELEGRLAGMAFLALTDRVPGPAHMDRRTGDIQSVYIVPELRNRGIGAQLLDAMFQHARDRELVFVTVHSASEAIRFYRRWGFDGGDRWLEWRPDPA